jgi:hypothetical protein
MPLGPDRLTISLPDPIQNSEESTMNHSIHLKLLLAAGAVVVVLAALGVPVLAYLPILAFFAVCTLAMMFMMRRMDHGRGSQRDDGESDGTPTAHRH